MRTNLMKLGSARRHRFSARIGRFGTKTNWNGYPEKTVCLQDVKTVDDGQTRTDHLWFTFGRTWEMLNPQIGDIIEFDARVGEYSKGYWDDRSWDYKLNRPTNMVIVQAAQEA